jgi:nitrate/nitrite transport system ATP-binding protein
MEIQADLGNTVIMITHDVDEAVLLSDRIVMMTNGPAATIGQILDIDLPRPRDRLELAEDPTFVHMRQQVLAFLYAKHDTQGATSEDASTEDAAEAVVDETPAASDPVSPVSASKGTQNEAA